MGSERRKREGKRGQPFMIVKLSFPFHVVHIKFHNQHRGYEIWYNNKPLIRLSDGLNLKRNEAYQFARSLNYGI